jgi:hypothetical protein
MITPGEARDFCTATGGRLPMPTNPADNADALTALLAHGIYASVWLDLSRASVAGTINLELGSLFTPYSKKNSFVQNVLYNIHL